MCLGPLPAAPSATRQQDTSQPHSPLATVLTTTPAPCLSFPPLPGLQGSSRHAQKLPHVRVGGGNDVGWQGGRVASAHGTPAFLESPPCHPTASRDAQLLARSSS